MFFENPGCNLRYLMNEAERLVLCDLWSFHAKVIQGSEPWILPSDLKDKDDTGFRRTPWPYPGITRPDFRVVHRKSRIVSSEGSIPMSFCISKTKRRTSCAASPCNGPANLLLEQLYITKPIKTRRIREESVTKCATDEVSSVSRDISSFVVAVKSNI